MFSMAIAISFFVGSGFVIASQTVMAVQFSYPYSSSAYNKAYNNNTSFYDNSANNKAYNPNNNDRNDKYSDSYSKFAGYSKFPRNDKIHECQKGPFEGFFTSSVEFCFSKY